MKETKNILSREQLEEYDGPDRVISSYEVQEYLNLKGKDFGLCIKSGIPALDRLTEGFREGELVVISGPTGEGKCHGRGTEVLLYDGRIKKVEDIRIGDNLMGDDSKPRRVLQLGSGFGRLYKIVPVHGRPFTANGDHILSLKRTGIRNIKRGRKTKTNHKGKVANVSVSSYREKSKTFKHQYKLYRVPVDFQQQIINIDPYILGLWLGDGHSNGPEITTADSKITESLECFCKKENLTLTKKDQPNNKASVYRICNKNVSKGKPNSFFDRLRGYGLIKNKHIPWQYLYNERNKRLELLAGIIDSDGYTNHNSYTLAIKNGQLVNDILFLARSLGFAAYANRQYQRSIKTLGFVGTYCRIGISGEVSSIPVRLEHKKCSTRKQKKDVLVTGIKKIVSLGLQDYYGFNIDGNGLYLLGDFTVTHNTLLAQTITYHITNRQDSEQPLWFSFEMPPKQFLRCFPSVPFFYLPNELKPYKWQWFIERCLENEAKHEGHVIIIDHLHFLLEFFKTGNPSLEIGRLVRKLKRLAVDNNYIVFLIAHISKIAEGNKAGLRHIRDSSFISQEADTVIMIQRVLSKKNTNQNRAVITVDKCRWTGVFSQEAYVSKVDGYLRELTDDFSA